MLAGSKFIAEGGAAVILLPQFLFGLSPITNCNIPPFNKSLCVNQGFDNTLPFNDAL